MSTKIKIKKKLDLFDEKGNLKQKIITHLDKTEGLFDQEAKRIDSQKLFLPLRKDTKKNSDKPFFLEIIQQLTIVNLLEIIFSPFLYLINKFKVKKQISESTEEAPDPFAVPKRRTKGGASFIILSLLFIFSFNFFKYFQKISNLKIKITNQSQQAVLALKEGQESVSRLNLSEAIASFDQAKNNFQEILNDFNQFGFLTKSFLNLNPKSKKTIEVSLALVEAGKSLAAVGEILAQSSQAVIAQNSSLKPNWAASIILQLANINETLNLALPKVAQAKSQLMTITIDEVPADLKEKFYFAQQNLPQIESGLINVSEITDILLKVSGYYQWQRYLLIFQNNNELRATGGFIGSFALLDIDRGQIKNLEIPAGGSYDLQGSLTATVASPKPLHLINPVWEFQDANWWPDFPTTAKKITWFYEKAGGPSVDGVIAITPVVMEKLLEIVGPVEMIKYNRTITAENFVAETQKIVELESKSYPSDDTYKTDNTDDASKEAMKPKQFLADLAPEILKRIFNLGTEKMTETLNILHKCLKEKHLLVYSTDPNIQKILAELNWSGEFIVPKDSDYLAVINTNIAGGKTDGVITQVINHQVEITAPGKIIDTVTVTRVHHGEKGNFFTGDQNNSYLRVYVPLGSRLLSASGFQRPDASQFEKPPATYSLDQDLLAIEGEHQIDPVSGTEIYTEFSDSPIRAGTEGKTVFANWLLIKPGEQKTVVLKYELPISLSVGVLTNGQGGTSNQKKLYKLFVQKQAGTDSDRFFSKIINGSGLKVTAVNPNGNFQSALEGATDTVRFTDKLVTDKVYEVVFE